MRCRTCKYEISNITERRCPECGCEFDPADPMTWSPLPPKAPWWWIATFSASGIFIWTVPALAEARSGFGWSVLFNPGSAIAFILLASAIVLVLDWYIRYSKFED